jgi:RimJ/RimL family protein N-acetyltransferase
VIIETPRLTLRCWRRADQETFAEMNADPEVMLDLGGPISRAASDAKLDRYSAAFRQHGFCRWAVDSRSGDFLGYAGVMPSGPEHPLGRHFEIGWRLMRNAWGHGYATEAARAALNDAFGRVRLREVVAYTSADNLRSQAVMDRLRLQRVASRDFIFDYGGGPWSGLVWVAHPT